MSEHTPPAVGAGSDWTYEMPPGKLMGNLRLLPEERYAALLALEQAGRQWHAAVARMRPYAGELVPWKLAGWQEAQDALAGAEAALEAALANLNAPPGESP